MRERMSSSCEYISSITGSSVIDQQYNELSFKRLLLVEKVSHTSVYQIKSFMTAHSQLINSCNHCYAIVATITSDLYRNKYDNQQNIVMITDLNSSSISKVFIPKSISQYFVTTFGFSSGVKHRSDDMSLSREITTPQSQCSPIGRVVLLINPKPIIKSSADSVQIDFEIENVTQFVIIGRIQHFSVCKGIRKNGESCKINVDTSKGEKCFYHRSNSYHDDMVIQAASAKAAAANQFTLIDSNMNFDLDNKHPNYLTRQQIDSFTSDKLTPLGSENPSNLSTRKDTDLAAQLGISSNIQTKQSHVIASSDNTDAEHSSNATISSVLSFASNIYLEKLKNKQLLGSTNQRIDSRMPNDIKPTITNNTVSSELSGNSSSFIPQRQISKIGQLSSSSPLQPISQKAPMRPDTLRMIGNVLVDTNILERNDRAIQKKKADIANSSKVVQAIKKQKIDNELDALLNRKSSHSIEADMLDHDAYLKHINKLAAKEAIALKKDSSSNTIFIKNGHYCKECNICFEELAHFCKQRHPEQVILSKLLKRFYECANCKKRTSILIQDTGRVLGAALTKPTRRCESCASDRWEPCGNSSSGMNFLGGGRDEKLVLSASEWASSKDIDSMNVRLGSLG